MLFLRAVLFRFSRLLFLCLSYLVLALSGYVPDFLTIEHVA